MKYCALFILSFTLMSSSAPDDEDCNVTASQQPGKLWGLDSCPQTSCGSSNCSNGDYHDGTYYIFYCGCTGSGGEPDCCHVVLRAQTMWDEFLPAKAGDCRDDLGCPGSCVMSGTTTKTASCN